MASPNFSMDELTHSDIAARHDIDNTPNENEKDNLYKLAMESFCWTSFCSLPRWIRWCNNTYPYY